MSVKAQVWERLGKVMDPELDISIVDLGLIYKVEVRGERIVITMTLTTPGCPLAPVIDQMIKEALGDLNGKIEIKLVWEPVWSLERMSEEGRLKLGIV